MSDDNLDSKERTEDYIAAAIPVMLVAVVMCGLFKTALLTVMFTAAFLAVRYSGKHEGTDGEA